MTPRWYAALWRACALVTTLVAGYLIAHVIVLGRFFNWIVAHGRADMLRDTYAVFRVEGDPVTPYLGTFVLQLLLALAVAISTAVLRRRLPRSVKLGALAAALALPLSIVMFGAIGFHTIEDKVMSATDLSPPVLAAWLRLNVPAHVTCALIYLLPAVWLTFVEPACSRGAARQLHPNTGGLPPA